MGIKHMTNAIYRAETGKVFWCMIAQLVISIVSVIATLLAVGGAAASIASGGDGAAAAGGAMVITILLALAGIALNIIILMAYSKLQKDFGDNTIDGSAFGKMKIAAILALVGTALSLIPVAGAIISIILSIVAYILYIVAFSALKKSETFPGTAGASNCFVGYILQIFVIIPIVGSIVALVGLIMVLVGWNKIKNAPLPEEA